MFFSPKNIDEVEMMLFWAWFTYNEFWIVDNISLGNHTVVYEQIKEKLTPIFPYFKKELKFNLEIRNGQGLFYFFGLNNKYLNRDASIVKASMPYHVFNRWEFIIINP